MLHHSDLSHVDYSSLHLCSLRISTLFHYLFYRKGAVEINEIEKSNYLYRLSDRVICHI